MKKFSKMLLLAAVPCIVATSFCLLSVPETYADEFMTEREQYASVRIVKVDYMNSLDNMLAELSNHLDSVTGSAVKTTRLVTKTSDGREVSPVIDDSFYSKVEEEALQDEKLAEKLELSLAEQKLSEMEEQLRSSEEARDKLEEQIKKAEARRLKAQQEAEEAKKAAKIAEKEVKKAKKAVAKSEDSGDSSSKENSSTKTSSYSKDLKVTYSDEDKEILRKIIAAEAGDQGYTGMQYVGEVIRNRCIRYEKSVEEVVFSPHQFSPVSNGTYETAYGKLSKETKEDIEKVIEALEDGVNEAQNAIYFKMYGYHSGCKPLFKYKDHYFSKD